MRERIFVRTAWKAKDHPYEVRKPGIYTFDEIRYWINQLWYDKRYGWTSRPALARALGVTTNWLSNDKLRGELWIWPREQYRLTPRINDILDGYIVPKWVVGACGGKHRRLDGVYCDPPEPPPVPKQRVIHLHAAPGKLSFLPVKPTRPPSLPQFRAAFENIPIWDPWRDDKPVLW